MLKPRSSFAKEYHLKKCIDVKGLAEVWEAASVKALLVDSVALKIYATIRTEAIKKIEEEFAKQPYLEHSHLLPARRLGIYENRPYLEMPFCNNGSISSKVLQLSENEIIKCFHQIASGLAYLHDNSILHKCIKPSNILIDSDTYYLYLPDLGLGPTLRETIENYIEEDENKIAIPRNNNPSVPKIPAKVSPQCYWAPELFETDPEFSDAADIWALGASIFETVTGKLPFGYLGGDAQRKNNIVLKDLTVDYPAAFNTLIKRCLSKNKTERPTAQEIVEQTNFFSKEKKSDIPIKKTFEALQSKQIDDAVSISQNVHVAPPPRLPTAVENNFNDEKKIKWKSVAIFFLPILLVACLLFAYIEWDSNSPDYTIKLLPSKIDSAKKKSVATHDTVANTNQLHQVSSKNNTVDVKKMPSIAIKQPTTISNTPITKKPDLPITPVNALPTIKSVQKKPQVTIVVQPSTIKASAGDNLKQPAAPKIPKKKNAEKNVDHGLPKHKDSEQVIDAGIPKHRDREQKNN